MLHVITVQGRSCLKHPLVRVSYSDKDNNRTWQKHSRALWVASSDCSKCHAAFGFFRRQHHCRSCGHAVCAQCSPGSGPVPKFGFEKPTRLCVSCVQTRCGCHSQKATRPNVDGKTSRTSEIPKDTKEAKDHIEKARHTSRSASLPVPEDNTSIHSPGKAEEEKRKADVCVEYLRVCVVCCCVL